MAGNKLVNGLLDGLSIGSGTGRTADRRILADVSAASSGTNPADSLANISPGSLTTVQVPDDRPEYYFKMLVKEYSRSNWLRMADSTLKGQIILPVPTSLIDTHTVEYEGEDLGMVGAAAIDVINGNRSGLASRGWEGAGRLVQGTIEGMNESTGKGILAATGHAINNYMTMMLRGPVFKQHQFTWRFSPNTVSESRALMALYIALNEAQAVGLSSWFGSAFFSFPQVFYPSFWYEGEGAPRMLGVQLYRFKPCVVTRSIWNFTPSDVPSFYSGSHAPESLQLTLELTELEYWLKGDFVAGLNVRNDDAFTGYTDVPPGGFGGGGSTGDF